MKDVHGGDIWGASKEASKSPGEILDFSASINPLGLPPAAASAIKRSLGLVPPYPEPAATSLAGALASFHGVAPDELLAANGSTQLIHLIPEVLRPERALIVEPAFSEYRSALERAGCRADGLVLKEPDFSLDMKRLASRLRKGYGVVYIANPANPTGALIGKEALLEAARLCSSVGATLVVDEAFADFVERESVKREAARAGNLIVLRSMTKFYAMAGLRLGFMVSDARTVASFSRAMPPWSVNTLAASASAAALKDTSYLKATSRWFASERAFLFDGLKGIPGLVPFPSEANFFLVKLPAKTLTAPELKAALLPRGILIRDLAAFRGLGPRYFRVSVRKRRDNEVLLSALGSVLTP
ncbi:MAG: threonine-phosphate decarboxylase CobD [Thermodesulfobacteriota bacterium]